MSSKRHEAYRRRPISVLSVEGDLMTLLVAGVEHAACCGTDLLPEPYVHFPWTAIGLWFMAEADITRPDDVWVRAIEPELLNPDTFEGAGR